MLGDSGDRVLKLYRTELRNPMFPNDARLEAACLQALENEGFVPQLRATGHHSGGDWVLYDHAPGVPWDSGTGRAASLLRKLHASTVSIPLPRGRNGSADIARHAMELLEMCASGVRENLLTLTPDLAVPPTERTCLIHGDPVAGNILVAGTSLTLIDWQCPAIGDPCEDISLFLSPAMQRLYRGSPLTLSEETAFLAAYAHPETIRRYQALRPWYAWRMAAYCLWRAEKGSKDYEEALQLELRVLRA